ncbi:MAG: VOC family protein [Acidimicrobiales bacterium]
MAIIGMNHAVLYVRDATVHQAFYRDVLDFETVMEAPDGQFVFMRGSASANHHDIAFFTIGPAAEPSVAGKRTVGLYHLAWQVATLDELVLMHERLRTVGALAGASDHGTSKSLYAKDPDGLEFEVMWLVPAEHWGVEAHEATTRPLDLSAEQRRFAALGSAAGTDD